MVLSSSIKDPITSERDKAWHVLAFAVQNIGGTFEHHENDISLPRTLAKYDNNPILAAEAFSKDLDEAYSYVFTEEKVASEVTAEQIAEGEWKFIISVTTVGGRNILSGVDVSIVNGKLSIGGI